MSKTKYLKYIVSRTPCAKRNTKRERSWRAEGRQLEAGVSRSFVSTPPPSSKHFHLRKGYGGQDGETSRRDVKSLLPPLVLTTALASLLPIFKKFSKTSFRSLFKNRDLSLTLLLIRSGDRGQTEEQSLALERGEREEAIRCDNRRTINKAPRQGGLFPEGEGL